jgi:hypothetical protein
MFELQLQQPDSMTLPSYRITIQWVHFMPDLNVNLLSVLKLEDCSIHIVTRLGMMNLVHEDQVLARATRSRGSYTLDLSTESAHSESAFAVTGNKITQDD